MVLGLAKCYRIYGVAFSTQLTVIASANAFQINDGLSHLLCKRKGVKIIAFDDNSIYRLAKLTKK